MISFRVWLRWVMVVPAAASGLSVAFLSATGVLLVGLWLSGPIPSVEWLPNWLLIVPWLAPAVGFVLAGARAAPSRKTITGMVLLFIYAFFVGDVAVAAMLLARLVYFGR